MSKKRVIQKGNTVFIYNYLKNKKEIITNNNYYKNIENMWKIKNKQIYS